jgi:hypothetical protein
VDGETGRPGWARWTAVCGLLLGLFLMHGAPSSATGCHDSMTGPTGTGSMTGVSPITDPGSMTGTGSVTGTDSVTATDSTAVMPPSPHGATTPGPDRAHASASGPGTHHATVRQAAPGTGDGGAVCLATAPPPGVAVPAVLLLAVLMGAGFMPLGALRTRGRARSRRRGPPVGGSELLLRVCVART